MKNLLTWLAGIVFLVFPHFIFSQDVSWNSTPQKGFVFQITNKEAQKLLTTSKPDTTFKRMLGNPIDTFDIKTGWNDRPSQGHFILVSIHKNKIHCEYTNVFPYQVFLLKEYNALALQVLDLEGNIRSDAKVKVGSNRVQLDTLTNTYRMSNESFRGKARYVTVELDGFRSVFNVEKHEAPSWYNNYDADDGPDFYSYMITDKNRYKPNEKVRFKSYALSGGKTPLRKELEVWILNYGKPKKIGSIHPQRPGSYASEFLLHDSLKLQLDKFYMLQLRERNSRVVASCSFKFEDYELFGNNLEIELKTEKQYHPSDNEVTIKATDVNGLMLKDATATIIITTNTIRETFDRVVVLPDTLLQRKILLDPVSPTVVPVPSALFGKSNVSYTVDVFVTNTENQMTKQTLGAVHYFSEYEIVSRFSNDSIIYEFQSSGVPLENIPAYIIHSRTDSLRTTLPFKEKINPAITEVRIETKSASRVISMNHLLPKLEIRGGIFKDSFNVSLNNPQKIEVSWFVYQENVLLKSGSGKSIEYKSLITDRTGTYYIELLYSFGGQENIQTREYPFADDILNVSIHIPERVYPGQTVETLIKVEDQQGRPVSNVDLTALAVTSKLGYYLPSLPYFGSVSRPRDRGTDFSKEDVNKRTTVLDLDYNRWQKLARLDTMKYYQFTYPHAGVFNYAYAIQDSTQFAPYVMKSGSAQQIYVIEVNREPVYFSWVTMPPQYSFYISSKKKSHITLRLHDRVLILDSIQFEQGKKTILSIDLDHLPKSVQVVKLYQPSRKNRKPPQFTPTEINRYTPLIAGFKPVSQKGYLESNAGFVPLFYYQSTTKFVTVGPISAGRQTFTGKTNDGVEVKPLSYQHIGGFNYEFQDNVVYKTDTKDLIPKKLFRNTYDPSTTLNDLVLTKKQFLENVPMPDNKWHARSIDLMDRSLRLSLLLPEEKEKTGIASILMEECKTGKIVSPCTHYSQQSGYYNLPRGCHKVIVLYNSGYYFKMDDVDLRSFTKAVINFNQSELHPPDKTSQEWLLFQPDNCFKSVLPPTRTFQLYSRRAVNGNVQGVVLSAEDNSPLPGVNVVVKGTMNGTATDINGHFSLSISESPSTLVISFIGLQTREVEVQAGSVISVLLQLDVTQLSEVVVTAMGVSHESRALGYSVTNVLQGRVAGVQIDDSNDSESVSAEEKTKQEISEGEQRLYQELLNLNSIRSNFSDVGFWEPTLFTNREGESKFNIKFPDNITRWDATVYAMNKRLQTGTVRKDIKSYKPLMAELHVPQFLTKGDSVSFIGKVLNYTQDSTIIGKIKWEFAGQKQEKEISFTGFHSDNFHTYVESTDTLKGRFVFTREDGYLDGEEREVPVIDQGIIRADGTLAILKNKEDVRIKASENENVIIGVLANQLDIYAGEAKYLLQYKYACNEQLASKLTGLINYKMIMKYEGKPFKYDKDVNRIITRLLNNQNAEFLWSWWDVSTNTSYWMSAHILRALKLAKDAGYDVKLNVENIKRKAEYKFDILRQYSLSDVDLMNALAAWQANLDFKKHIRKLDALVIQTEKEYQTNKKRYYYSYSLLKEKLLLLEARQLVQLPFQPDSLLKYQKKGIMGDVHFTDGRKSNYWYNNDLSSNAIAYRIVRNDSSFHDLLIPMQMYFISQRNLGEWNTYHSSNVLTSVLPDLLKQGVKKKQEATIHVSGSVNTTVSQFPYQLELKPEEEVVIRKEAGLPVYLMQYKKERVTKAKTGVEGFEIKTLWSNDQTILEAGKPITLTVEVIVKKDVNMQYVMIEVPIPGACSYAEKTQHRNYFETHREYFKEKTVIFCENLKEGKYTFNIQLLPRFTGKYIINPSQVSLMYVPVVNANTDMKSVKVK